MNIRASIEDTRKGFEESFASEDFYNRQTQDAEHLERILAFINVRDKSMKGFLALTAAVALLLSMTSCSNTEVPASEFTSVITSESTTSASAVLGTTTEVSASDTAAQTESSETEAEMVLRINDQVVQVEWEDNESVEALKELASNGTITIEMSMYGGFEQVGPVGTDLPRNDEQTTTSPGDIVLYSGDQIVVFYGSNSWAYTRLGNIQNMSEEDLRSFLGSSDVTLTIYCE